MVPDASPVRPYQARAFPGCGDRPGVGPRHPPRRRTGPGPTSGATASITAMRSNGSARREGLATWELLSNLTMREVRGRYKRSLLGQTWSLLNPIASLAIYSLVFGFVLKAEPAPGDPS